MSFYKQLPIIGFVAKSGTGKTTLLEKLLPHLIENQLKIGLIKHSHHDLDIDYPGKDSYRLRKAGAIETLVASKNRWALIHENKDNQHEPNLWELVSRIDHKNLDLILVEGFNYENYPKIELIRNCETSEYKTSDTCIIAIATDKKMNIKNKIPVLDINSPAEICRFILDNIVTK